MKKTQIEPPRGIIDLGIGQPSLSLLPLGLLREASSSSFDRDDRSFLQYGPDEGSGYFRQVLSGFLSAQYGSGVRPDSLFITNGISAVLDLVCTVFTSPGDTIIVEEPSYFYVFDIFKNHNLRIESVPVREDGIDLEILEDKVKQYRPSIVYTIPVFHNPSSCVLSASKRIDIISLSGRYNFRIISDEAYQLLGYTMNPPPAFACNDISGNVLSLGSFSKILAPGLRLGWIHCTKETVSKLAKTGFIASGGGLNPFAGDIVASCIEANLLLPHIAFLKRTYSARLDALSGALESYMPGVLRFTKPGGGFFIWAELPPQSDTSSLLAVAIATGVSFKPGCIFSHRSGLQRFLRLSCSYYDEDDLVEGAERLSLAYNGWLAKQ